MVFNKKHLNIFLAVASFFITIACGVSREAQLKLAKPHFEKGEKYLSEGKLDLAESEFKEASVIAPNHAKPIGGLGNVYFKKGRTDDALAQYEKAIAIYPFDPEINYYVALVLDKKADIQGSVTRYKVALMNIPENNSDLLIKVNLGLGIAYLKLSNYGISMNQFKKVIELDALMSIPHYYIGKIYMATNKINIAIDEYEKSISLLYLLEDTEDNRSYISNLFKDYEEALKSAGIQSTEITQRIKTMKKIQLF